MDRPGVRWSMAAFFGWMYLLSLSVLSAMDRNLWSRLGGDHGQIPGDAVAVITCVLATVVAGALLLRSARIPAVVVGSTVIVAGLAGVNVPLALVIAASIWLAPSGMEIWRSPGWMAVVAGLSLMVLVGGLTFAAPLTPWFGGR